ncbi:hypothetical protein [Sphingomonas sp. CGMCC 1.13658]|uniref:hypothetical protein n=1 Tax=Sphingomonas sp. CGMCC 1.13658 TaxID=2755554 RepID=UPI001C677A81|nr:hypothetical protein [Sphingomonas sp. CGMCC 1.13658]
MIVNVATNLLFLGRSYLTMLVLDYDKLGLVTLLQSVILLVGALQFGFLNGGYRLLCDGASEASTRINDVVYTALCVIGIISIAAALLAMPFSQNLSFALVLLVGAAAGGWTLVRTWVANQLIAFAELRMLNRATLLAAIASLALLVLVPAWPLLACMASVAAQPVVFVAYVLARRADLRPRAISFDMILVRRIMASGFIVFLTGIFLQANTQFERWYVVGTLGIDSLGHLYLVFLFITLFNLMPTTFDAIFLPRLVRSRRDGDMPAVAQGIRSFLVVQLSYCLAAALALAVLAAPVLKLILPRYLPDLRYVYVVAPGLILFTLATPFAIVFNVLIRYRTYLLAYGAGTVITAALLGASLVTRPHLGLDGVMMVRAGAYAVMAVILIAGYVAACARYPEFQLFQRHRKGRQR